MSYMSVLYYQPVYVFSKISVFACSCLTHLGIFFLKNIHFCGHDEDLASKGFSSCVCLCKRAREEEIHIDHLDEGH